VLNLKDSAQFLEVGVAPAHRSFRLDIFSPIDNRLDAGFIFLIIKALKVIFAEGQHIVKLLFGLEQIQDLFKDAAVAVAIPLLDQKGEKLDLETDIVLIRSQVEQLFDPDRDLERVGVANRVELAECVRKAFESS